VKHGSVSQRHTRACPRDEKGGFLPHRCKGSWKWTLEYGKDSNGRRLQASTSGFATKAAAQTALRQAVDLYGSGVELTHQTVQEYLSTWLAAKHALKPKTIASYSDLTALYIIPHIGSIRLLDLRAHHLDTMYIAIQVGRRGRVLSPSTIRRVHAVLRSALNSAVRRRLIPYNAAEYIELAPENPRRPKPWTAEQARKFLEINSQDRLAALYELMLLTGMRRGEAIGLRWEDVDLDGRCLFIVQQITEVRGRSVVGKPKTKRGTRVVPIDVTTAATLRRHQAGQQVERLAWGSAWNEQDLVFTRENGLPLRPEYATRHFQALTQRADLPAIRLHDLRHTNASLALEAGVALKVVSDRLGHSQTAITADLYTHVNITVARAAADQIASTLRSTSETLPDASLTHPAISTGSEADSAGSTEGEEGASAASSQVSASESTETVARARRDSNPQPSDP